MIDSYLLELADDARPILHSGLLQLSAISTVEISELEAIWPSISETRRHEIISKMLTLADDNPELDFDDIFLALLKDPDGDLRAMAARGLWECEDRNVIQPLIELLKEDPSAQVRSAAAISLGRFATMAAEGKLTARDAERVEKALMAAVNRDGEDQEVIRRSIEAAAPLATPEITEIIRSGYRSDDARIRQSAVHAMGRAADPQWMVDLIEALDSDDPALRYEAAASCGMVGEESAVPHLISLLQGGDGHVEVAAVRALGAIGGDLAKRALIRCLDFGDEAVESAAEAALNEIEALDDPTGFRF